MSWPQLTRGAMACDLILVTSSLLFTSFVGMISGRVGRAMARWDSVLYTMLSGAAIGAVSMCGIPHTVGHGAVDAFLGAALLGAGGGLAAGAVGRMVGALSFPQHERIIRWFGNIAAFAVTPFVIAPLALA